MSAGKSSAGPSHGPAKELPLIPADTTTPIAAAPERREAITALVKCLAAQPKRNQENCTKEEHKQLLTIAEDLTIALGSKGADNVEIAGVDPPGDAIRVIDKQLALTAAWRATAQEKYEVAQAASCGYTSTLDREMGQTRPEIFILVAERSKGEVVHCIAIAGLLILWVSFR